MCGIAGFYSTRVNVDNRSISKAMRVLAREMETRGNHSWGLMDAETVTHSLGRITKGMRLPKQMPRTMALHTRYATTGKIKESNAHPFVMRSSYQPDAGPVVIGMHNGVISNHSQLNRVYQRKCRVDSQHIFAHIADQLPFNDLEGYGTIVYTLDGQWHIGTFNGGELCLYETRAGYVFASTEKAVHLALDAGNLWNGARKIKTEDNTVYTISDAGLHIAYTVKVQETKWHWDDYLYDRTSKRQRKKTGFASVTDHEGETCIYCNETMGLGAWGYCDRCGMPTEGSDLFDDDSTDDDFYIDTMPANCAEKCCECHTWIESGEECAACDKDVWCMDCLASFDAHTEPDDTPEVPR